MDIISVTDAKLKKIISRASLHGYEKEEQIVGEIIAQVRKNGDKALLQYAKQFDKADLKALSVSPQEIKTAYSKVAEEVVQALKTAKKNIEQFHQWQKPKSWQKKNKDGGIVGNRYLPLERVGIYIPGGRANYPSTVLMNAIPAKVAGVEELVMVSPPRSDGSISPAVLVAADIAGVDRIFKIGGAQAVAALAYGTKSVPRVDKITGPGNIYVTLAKKRLYGQVGIDMLAGPSEVLVVADDSGIPAYIAADLLSQAEHDPLASAILVTPSKRVADAVQKEVEKQLKNLPKRDIAGKSVAEYGAIILVKNLKEAIGVVNLIAPEHLELQVKDPDKLLPQVKHAGAIFIGNHTPEPVGDYWAGPNHTLPTSGTARWSSPLSTEDFMKKSSILSYSEQSLKKAAPGIIALTEEEALHAHGNSIQIRIPGNKVTRKKK